MILIRDTYSGVFIAVFFNLFQVAEPFKNVIWFGGTYTLQIVLFIAFSGNPAMNLRNLWVPRNPGWKTLIYSIALSFLSQSLFYTNASCKEMKKDLHFKLHREESCKTLLKLVKTFKHDTVLMFWVKNMLI
jgi:hypothetical protein